MKLTIQLALGVYLLMVALLTTPTQGMQNVVYRTSNVGNSVVECTECQQKQHQQPIASTQYFASPGAVVATAPLQSYTKTTTTITQQRGGGIVPPSRIYSPPYIGQNRVVNIEPSPTGGTRYATTTYYTDYYGGASDGGVASTCTRCDDVANGGGGGGGVNGRVVNNQIYSSADSAVGGATYGGGGGSGYDDSQGCSRNPCGANALCQETLGGRAVCSCPAGYSGNPISYCRRAECLDHADCRGDMACRNGNCVNPCSGTCGSGSNCEVRNHVPVCSCPVGYRGDPFSYCRQADPEELCHPSPCGQNTKCEVVNGVPTCSCLIGFTGSPLAGCRHECESDGECNNQQNCKDFRCQSACSQCGEGAQCSRVQNHRAVCECPKGYIGSPYTSCRPECFGDRDCPAGRPACFYGICKNPCEGSCGVGADCNLRGLTPICSCPKDMTGDPFISCRPFTKEDLCSPNPCGTNAQCQPGYDNTNKERPVCTCFPGYTGNPLSHCVRGECQSDSECGDHRACINYSCVNPCVGQCGAGAICDAKRHLAVCKCPEGTQGDALSACSSARTFPVARYH